GEPTHAGDRSLGEGAAVAARAEPRRHQHLRGARPGTALRVLALVARSVGPAGAAGHARALHHLAGLGGPPLHRPPPAARAGRARRPVAGGGARRRTLHAPRRPDPLHPHHCAVLLLRAVVHRQLPPHRQGPAAQHLQPRDRPLPSLRAGRGHQRHPAGAPGRQAPRPGRPTDRRLPRPSVRRRRRPAAGVLGPPLRPRRTGEADRRWHVAHGVQGQRHAAGGAGAAQAPALRHRAGARQQHDTLRRAERRLHPRAQPHLRDAGGGAPCLGRRPAVRDRAQHQHRPGSEAGDRGVHQPPRRPALAVPPGPEVRREAGLVPRQPDRHRVQPALPLALDDPGPPRPAGRRQARHRRLPLQQRASGGNRRRTPHHGRVEPTGRARGFAERPDLHVERGGVRPPLRPGFPVAILQRLPQALRLGPLPGLGRADRRPRIVEVAPGPVRDGGPAGVLGRPLRREARRQFLRRPVADHGGGGRLQPSLHQPAAFDRVPRASRRLRLHRHSHHRGDERAGGHRAPQRAEGRRSRGGEVRSPAAAERRERAAPYHTATAGV
ncbi:MAG: Animal haem peroxidase, partial [uncultured Acetobacteraceae bacterium]